jgi:D-alanyl-D-alanine carboxypeptidase (penicillin-binding protein 5/6)
MTSYALNNEYFIDLIGTERMVIDASDAYQARYLKNKDRLLFSEKNCLGGKTGFTDNAGRCLVNVHEENNMKIISVVLNCQPMFDECQRLTDLALDEYLMKDFISPYNFVSNINIEDSDKTEIGVITVKGYSLPILKSEEDKYEIIYDIPKSLVAPIKLNEKVGSVKLLKDGELIYEDVLITIEDADNNDIKYLIDNIDLMRELSRFKEAPNTYELDNKFKKYLKPLSELLDIMYDNKVYFENITNTSLDVFRCFLKS